MRRMNGYNNGKKILAQSERLPHNMRLIVENGELYLSFGETSLTPETLDEYMTNMI